MSDDWITIAEAARLLGISERTARRHAARLSGVDRQVSGACPARVRHSAMAAAVGRTVADRPEHTDAATDTMDDDRHLSGDVRHSDRQESGTCPAPPVTMSENEARLLTQLLATKDAEIEALRRTVAALEGNVIDLRRLLPPAPEPTPPRRWWGWRKR